MPRENQEQTHRHLSIISILVCCDPNSGLDRASYITLLRVHLHQLLPRLDGVSLGIEATLIRLLRLFLVVQSETKIPKYFPFEGSLTIRDVLSFEVGNLGAEDSPDTQILGRP